MRVLAVTSFVVFLSLTSAYPQQSVDPAYLQQYYQQIAQQTQAARAAGGATPIYEQEDQEQAPQYVPQGQQYRIKDTVSEQARQQQQAPQQQTYSAPVVRQQQQHYEQPQAQPEPQAQYISQQQPVVYKAAPKQQIRRPAPQPQYQEPQHQSQGQRLEKDEEEDYGNDSPNYQFGFDVKDDEFTNYQNRKESREGNVIKGSYSVVDSDGFLRTVNYVADPKEGFKAEVVRTPTDIVIKVPTQQTPETRHQPQPQQHQQQHQPQQQQQQQQPQYAQHQPQYRQPQQAQKAAPQYQYE